MTLLKSKIHRATVTGASLDYEGSLTVSADIAEIVDLLAYEKILVGNLQNGERFETYLIYGAPRRRLDRVEWRHRPLGKIGDLLTIMSFARVTPEEARTHHPEIVVLDRQNRVMRRESGRNTDQPERMGRRNIADIDSLKDRELA